MATNVALVKGNVVVNVVVVDEAVPDLTTWAGLMEMADELVILDPALEQAGVWIGSERKTKKGKWGRIPQPKSPDDEHG